VPPVEAVFVRAVGVAQSEDHALYATYTVAVTERMAVIASYRAGKRPIMSVFLAFTWLGWYMQNASLGERTRADLWASADQIADSFASDVSACLNFIDAIMNYLASFDAANGLTASINLIRDNRLYSDLETNLIVADASGHGVFTGPDGTGDVSDRDRLHMRAALNYPNRSLIIGSPLVGKAAPSFDSVRAGWSSRANIGSSAS
jgi:hypothetical protein